MSVQPRIKLIRSFDQRSHSYLGYVLRVQGSLSSAECECLVAIGIATQVKHRVRAGDRVSGKAVRTSAPTTDLVDLHKVSRFEVFERVTLPAAPGPPWHGVAPPLSNYRERGHRRLDARTYASKCAGCIWGCRMPVQMIVDQWNPEVRRYREETFCYGPLSCQFHRAGANRSVPGRKGTTWVEDDWVDDAEVGHRAPDE